MLSLFRRIIDAVLDWLFERQRRAKQRKKRSWDKSADRFKNAADRWRRK